MINKERNLDDDSNQNHEILIKTQDEDTSAQLTDDVCINVFNRVFRLAEQGHMEAQFKLANLYALGQGTPKSQVNAYQWYTKAALQGYKKALIRIHNLYQQDKKMYCRGQLDSSEERWDDQEFKKKNNIRELNEYRREQQASILNNAVDYYTNQFKKYKSSNQESMETDLNLAFLYQYGYGTRKNMLLAFDFYQKAAEQGHKDAQYGLANLYQSNPNMKFNYRLALRWYRASATSGNITAQNCLAYFYEKGLATELNYEGAIYWYMKAANFGSSSAQLTLGRLYRKGQGVEQNLPEAIKWYKLAAHQGNSAAQNCLNQLYLAGKVTSASKGNSVSQTPVTFTLHSKLQNDIIDLGASTDTKKLKTLSQHALMTDGHAMYQIGLKYYDGEDFPQDKDAGFQWIKKAAKAGIQDAELKIARMYEDGDIVEQDYHQSSIWTTKSVKKRNDTSLIKIGSLYKNGLGVRKDPLEASKWFSKSVDRGNAHTEFQFALLQFHGAGIRENKEEAFRSFYKLALLGNADALYQLGWLYENDDSLGTYIPKEIKGNATALSVEEYKAEATKMYESAASLGNPGAHFQLAKKYEKGQLVKQDLVKAHEYYTMAAKSDNPHYQAELALKYLNGVFSDIDYTKAFNLFKKAAEKKEARASSIFKTPIEFTRDIRDYSKVIDMFMLASARGVKGIDYNIAHAYEHGIYFEQHTTFSRNYVNSKVWYSIAARRGDYRAKYRAEVIYEEEKKFQKYKDIALNGYSLAYENGNTDIAYNLALMYLRGENVSQDFIKAFHLFTAASNMGHKDAREKLVLSKYKDSGNIEMLEAVASSGNVAVQYQLGIYFKNKNDSKSIKWLTLAAEGRLNDAYYQLGVLYEEGKVAPTDYSKAIASYKKAIKGEHGDALYRLAKIHHYGRGIERDYQKAYELYTSAANLGHIDALKVLNPDGKPNLLSHEKVNQEPLDSSADELNSNIAMLEFVAKQGEVDIQFKLGYFYENNEDKQNYPEAFKWYEMAAGKNHTEAIYRLGLMYENGLGVEHNHSRSIQLYTQAKNQGSRYALYRLGIAFHYGHGVDQNFDEAVDFYTKADTFGNHEAQYALGKLYETGEIVQKDIMKALVLYTKAYTNENTDVVSNLHNLYDNQPFKNFGQKLFQNLSKFENPKRKTLSDEQIDYGSIYYRLGKMYLRGIGTEKNAVEALKRFLKAQNQYGYNDAKYFTTFRYNKYNEEKDTYIQRMDAYFEIRDTLDSEQQYLLGMLYYEEIKAYYEKSSAKKENNIPFLITSKEDNKAYQYLFLAAVNNHRKSQYQLGIMFVSGYGVEKDEEKAIEWISKYIKTASSARCYTLGMSFYNGHGVTQNYRISYMFIKKAAESKHREAQIQLRAMRLNGYGVEKSYEESMKWFQRSIKEMDKYSLYKQGMQFYQGDRVEQNYDLARLYLKKAADENHDAACMLLGLMYLHGYGVEQNQEEAMKLIQQSIKEMGNYSCYKQGMQFYQGSKVEKNYDLALLYIKKAADVNFSEAYTQLGKMYLHGYGTTQNYEEAMKWIQQSIKETDKHGCYKQGMQFYLGDGIEQNFELALLYIKKAADENFDKAQAQLGKMYLHGYGVEQNYEEAMKWIQQSIKNMRPSDCYEQGMEFYQSNRGNYDIALPYIKKAADGNDHYAQAELGLMHLYGYGVEQNHKKAMEWIQKPLKEASNYILYELGMRFYRNPEVDDTMLLLYMEKAAEKNYGAAQVQLGLMYLNGRGVEKNLNKAIEWITLSVENSYPEQYHNHGMKVFNSTDTYPIYEASLLYFIKAAKNGNIYSQAQLGHMYLHGYGVRRDLDEAARWYNQAIDEYQHQDAHKIGQIYHCDICGIQDFSKAFEWYLIESENPYSRNALHGIGLLYEYGDGVDQDYQKAFQCYKELIGSGDLCSSYNIGLLYYYGRGVDKNYNEAFSYFSKIAEDGSYSENCYIFIEDLNEDARGSAFESTHRKYSLQDKNKFRGEAYYYIGLMYENGQGRAQDKSEAKIYFKKAFDYGVERAKSLLK